MAHPPISVLGLNLCSSVSLFSFPSLTHSPSDPFLATQLKKWDSSAEERNPTLRVNGTVCRLNSLGLFGLAELHLRKVDFLDALQGRLRYMSLAVTEVMLTMGRWLRGKWTVFTALILKGSNFESSNSTCREGKNVETVVGRLPKS